MWASYYYEGSKGLNGRVFSGPLLSVCIPLKRQLTSLLFNSPVCKWPSLQRHREEDYSLERSGMWWVNKSTETEIEAVHIKNQELEDEKSCE